MRSFLVLIVLLIAISFTGCRGNVRPTLDPAAITTAAPEGQLQSAALHLVNLLDQEDYASAFALFNDPLKQEMPTEKIKRDWRDVVLTAGSFEKPMKSQTKSQENFEFITITAVFSDGILDIEVAFDQSGKIAGLHFYPSK
jgi:hypothetical protein